MAKSKNIRGAKRGQAMLIAVLSLGGAMLGATAIAGLLILYQVRATTDSVSSAKSIFAADTGVEWALFSYFCMLDVPARCTSAPPAPAPFPNSATVAATCYDANNVATACYNNPNVSYAVSIGSTLNTRRAFYLDLLAATSSFP